ncbi:hypothetical protein MMC07_007799 [Pseudocyphellaria aurata]|nr:hypothetical protein [Pseudocyphellaria aurata]
MAQRRHDDMHSPNVEQDRGSTPSRRYQSMRSNDAQPRIRRPMFLCAMCLITFRTLDELNAHKDGTHFYCKVCVNGKCHRDQYRLEKHYQKAHPQRWCQHCRQHFDSPTIKLLHDNLSHEYCRLCRTYFKNLSKLGQHIAQKHPTRTTPVPANKPVVGKYYSLLNISPTASHEDVVRAARQARIDTHPDRLCRPELSDHSRAQIVEQAKEVGRAADVLCDVRKRRDYDEDVKFGRKE